MKHNFLRSFLTHYICNFVFWIVKTLKRLSHRRFIFTNFDSTDTWLERVGLKVPEKGKDMD